MAGERTLAVSPGRTVLAERPVRTERGVETGQALLADRRLAAIGLGRAVQVPHADPVRDLLSGGRPGQPVLPRAALTPPGPCGPGRPGQGRRRLLGSTGCGAGGGPRTATKSLAHPVRYW